MRSGLFRRRVRLCAGVMPSATDAVGVRRKGCSAKNFAACVEKDLRQTFARDPGISQLPLDESRFGGRTAFGMTALARRGVVAVAMI